MKTARDVSKQQASKREDKKVQIEPENHVENSKEMKRTRRVFRFALFKFRKRLASNAFSRQPKEGTTLMFEQEGQGSGSGSWKHGFFFVLCVDQGVVVGFRSNNTCSDEK